MSRDVHGCTSVAEDMDVRERPDIKKNPATMGGAPCGALLEVDLAAPVILNLAVRPLFAVFPATTAASATVHAASKPSPRVLPAFPVILNMVYSLPHKDRSMQMREKRPICMALRQPGDLGSFGESSVASRRKRGPVAFRPRLSAGLALSVLLVTEL